MAKSKLLLAPAVTLGVLALAAPGAAAQPQSEGSTGSHQGSGHFQAQLNELNGSGGSGTTMLSIDGNQATVTQNVSGLAETFDGGPYPHVQHIHIAAQGVCPSPDADANGDGIVDTVEGQPAYGEIGTTLTANGSTSPEDATDLSGAGMGGSFSYERTFEINAETAQSVMNGTGVVVVHGLDPANLSQQAQDAPSNLVPELPLAATTPALCGTLEESQMAAMPQGGVDTGGGSSAHGDQAGLVALGGGLLAAAAGAFAVTRRTLTGR